MGKEKSIKVGRKAQRVFCKIRGFHSITWVDLNTPKCKICNARMQYNGDPRTIKSVHWVGKDKLPGKYC